MATIFRMLTLVVLGMIVATPSVRAAEIDRTAVEFQTPSEIKWIRNAAGTNEQAVLFGDPSKAGPYVVRLKWLPGNMSRPHFHPNDRFFIVISGTWWMGTGEKFDPDNTVPACPEARRGAASERGRGKPAEHERPRRRSIYRARRARWFRDHDGKRRHARNQCGTVQESGLRPDAGFRADHRDRLDPARARHPPVGACEIGQRIDCARAKITRQAQRRGRGCGGRAHGGH